MYGTILTYLSLFYIMALFCARESLDQTSRQDIDGHTCEGHLSRLELPAPVIYHYHITHDFSC